MLYMFKFNVCLFILLAEGSTDPPWSIGRKSKMGMKSSQAQVPDIYFFHEFAGCAPQLYDVVTIVSFFLITRARYILVQLWGHHLVP